MCRTCHSEARGNTCGDALHEITAENTEVTGEGTRCKACKVKASARSWAKRARIIEPPPGEGIDCQHYGRRFKKTLALAGRRGAMSRDNAA